MGGPTDRPNQLPSMVASLDAFVSATGRATSSRFVVKSSFFDAKSLENAIGIVVARLEERKKVPNFAT